MSADYYSINLYEGKTFFGRPIEELGSPALNSEGELVAVPIRFVPHADVGELVYKMVLMGEEHPYYYDPEKERVHEIIKNGEAMPRIVWYNEEQVVVEAFFEEGSKVVKIPLDPEEEATVVIETW